MKWSLIVLAQVFLVSLIPTTKPVEYSKIPCYTNSAYYVEKPPEPIVEPPRQTISRDRAETIQQYAKRRVNESFGAGQWESFSEIVHRESSWNPQAVNKSSGACGLMQAMPCSKVGGTTGEYWNNPQKQIEWGINYIQGRYGTPNKALIWWDNHHWY